MQRRNRSSDGCVRKHRVGGGGDSRPAFTLIELLVVISIIGLLLSILMPALSASREEGRKAVCMSNLRQIGTAMTMYVTNTEDAIPWVNPAPGAGWISQFVWGGFIAPKPDPYFGQNIDYALHPAEARPLNKYLSPLAEGKEIIPIYICPSDRTRGFGIVGSGGFPIDGEEAYRSWEAAGNSYAINWWWMNYYVPSGNWSVNQMNQYQEQLLKPLRGGKGSTFVVVYEALMHPLLLDAMASGGGIQSRGWHRRWSQHGALFLDGHSENRYMDTRYPYGTGWTIWPDR